MTQSHGITFVRIFILVDPFFPSDPPTYVGAGLPADIVAGVFYLLIRIFRAFAFSSLVNFEYPSICFARSSG